MDRVEILSGLRVVDRRHILGAIVRTLPLAAATIVSLNEYNTVSAISSNASTEAASRFPNPEAQTASDRLVTQAQRLQGLYSLLQETGDKGTSISRRGFLGISISDDPIIDPILQNALEERRQKTIRGINDEIRIIRASPEFQVAVQEDQDKGVAYKQAVVAAREARSEEENRLREAQGVTSIRYRVSNLLSTVAGIGFFGTLYAALMPIALKRPSWPLREETSEPQVPPGEKGSKL